MAEQKCDFYTYYSNQCLKSKVCVSQSVVKHLKGTALCCRVERIRCEHWQLLLNALKIDNSLTKLCFKSYLPSLEEQEKIWKNGRKINGNYPIPYGYSPDNIRDICKYTALFMTQSLVLTTLIIENLPITIEDAKHLAEGLKKSQIKEFAFRRYLYSDDVIENVCRGLWDSKISLLDFSDCNLSIVGLKFICNVIVKHKDRRSVEKFQETLRNQDPKYENMLGLSRIILSGNKIGDKGIQVICDALSSDDRWIQALDLQCCGITDEGAKVLLKQLSSNTSIQVVDLRLNEINEGTMEKISQQLIVNNVDKNINHTLMPLWEPRMLSKNISVFKNKPKTKVMKKYSRTSISQMNSKKIEHSHRISYEAPSDKNINLQDAFDTKLMQLQDKVKTLKFSLKKEVLERKSLNKLIEKLEMENVKLREAVTKLSNFENLIVMDRETYSQVKDTFEKFEMVLKLLKDNGLWNFKVTNGFAECEDIKLKAVPNDSKICMTAPQQLDECLTNGPVESTSILKSHQSQFSSNQKSVKESLRANVNHNKHIAIGNDKSQLKNIINESKVREVFKKVRDTYTNGYFSKEMLGISPLAKKLPSGHLPADKKHITNSKHLLSKEACSEEVAEKLYSIKTHPSLYDAIRDEVKRQKCDCKAHCKHCHSLQSTNDNSHLGHQNKVGAFKVVCSLSETVASSVNNKSAKANQHSLPETTAITHQHHVSKSPSSPPKSSMFDNYPSSISEPNVNLISSENNKLTWQS